MCATNLSRQFVCQSCGHIYDEAQDDSDSGILPGTRWEDLPADWSCPDCGASQTDFALVAG